MLNQVLTPDHTYTHGPGEKLRVVSRSCYLGTFSLMFNTAIIKASKEVYEAMPTLGVLIGSVEYDNIVRIRTVAIARELNVSLATVERHMRKLRELSVIEPDAIEEDKQRGITSWRICPFLAWKGSSDKLSRYLKTLPTGHAWFQYVNTEKDGNNANN